MLGIGNGQFGVSFGSKWSEVKTNDIFEFLIKKLNIKMLSDFKYLQK